MSITTRSQESPSLRVLASNTVPYYPLSVEQFHRMADVGVFDDDNRVELLQGYLALMSPIGPSHSFVVQRVYRSLAECLPEGWHVRMQQPLTFGQSEPQPDIAVIRGMDFEFRARHPAAAEVALVVEVAESSIASDRDVKSGVYAAEGIPEYWIINLVDRQVEIHRDPATNADGIAKYDSTTVIRADGQLPIVIDGRELGQLVVATILP